MMHREADGHAQHSRIADFIWNIADDVLRDTDRVPPLAESGITGFMAREVLRYAAEAWVEPGKTQVGYEISFTRHFYKPKPLRTLAEIRADIEVLERETEGLLDEIQVG